MSTFTTITEAINSIADRLNLTIEGATWVYENTDCPDWDSEDLATYDFFADPKTAEIPEEFI